MDQTGIMKAQAELTAWTVCGHINHDDKAYFLHQLDGFDQISPFLVVWEDRRALGGIPPAAKMPGPWEMRWRFPGGHRLLGLARRLRGAVRRSPLAASRREMAAMRGWARQTPPDVIYAHTGFVGLRLLPLKEKLGVPLVVHFHGLDINISDPVYQRVLRREIHHFDRIIVVGNWMIAPLVAMGYDADRIDVVPMGAPIEDLPIAAPARGGPVRFIAVARMIPYKGLDRTIAAFAQMRGTHQDSELHLVGDGPQRAALERQAAPLGKAVVFHGSRPSVDTLALIAGSDVLVHHALDHPGGPEAFGVVITEAMARGLPVVGTRCGGLPDQIVDGETGLLVDQNDVDGMAAAMARLADDPDLRAAMGQAGRARAVEMFDAHVLARRAEEVLLEVVG